MTGWHNRPSAKDRGYSAGWKAKRKRVAERDHHLCQPCLKVGRVTPFDEVDHIIPKAKGGGEDDDNLQCICRDCHKAKTDKEAAEAQGRRIKPTIGADGWPI